MIPFEVAAPNVDETPQPGESPEATALRLSGAKARAVADTYPDALIIGSDQVAVHDGLQLDKPLNYENASWQLRRMRGQCITFHTAISLLNSRTGNIQSRVVPCAVTFRNYGDDLIERYLAKEQPYHCAGSAKTEGLGIALIHSIRGDDPNALIGLPLIALIDMLNEEGVEVV